MGVLPSQPQAVNEGNAERFRGVYDAGDPSGSWYEGAGGDSLTLSMTPPSEEAAAPYFATRLMRVGEVRYVGADSPDVIEVRFLLSEGGEACAGATFDVVGIPWEATRRAPDHSDVPPPD